MLKAGLIGCGNISGAYLRNKDIFKHLRVVKCASRRDESARATAEQFGLQAVTVDGLLRDPEIDMILNLTTPDAHAEINLRALEAGKHVYTEKPFAITREKSGVWPRKKVCGPAAPRTRFWAADIRPAASSSTAARWGRSPAAAPSWRTAARKAGIRTPDFTT